MTSELKCFRLVWAVGLALVLGLGLSATGCGKSKEAEAAAGEASPDCAAVGQRIVECGDAFWSAYAVTGMAMNNSPGPDTSNHVADVRMLYGGDGGGEKLCVNMADMFGANPRWTPRVQACMAESSCDAWARCIAPVLTAAAR